MKFTFLLLFFTLLLKSATPYSSGAPNNACGDMVPQHNRDPQTSAPPYSVKPANSTIEAGERLLLEIDGQHVGFFVQAHDSSNKPIGTFFTSTYKTATCGQGVNNAITHGNSDSKDKITMQWESPDNFEGDVVFKATMVQSSPVFWVAIPSPKVKVTKRSAPTNRKSEAAPAVEVKQKSEIEKMVEDIYVDCGTYKTCFGVERNCVKNKNCKTLVTFTKNSNQYDFELLGDRTNRPQYLSVGLSDDISMGDDAVVSCIENDGQFKLVNSWNNGYNNQPVSDEDGGLDLIMNGFTDKKMYCKFSRDAVTTVERTEFDLDAKTFHVMVAAGPLSTTGSPIHHGGDKRATANFVSLGETSAPLSAGSPFAEHSELFRTLHASFMICAWIGAASCGIIFARYFKKTWLNYKCMKIDQWFHMHRFFMILTWCLTVAGVVLIALAKWAFVYDNHVYCGIASGVLCFIQPFMAVFRCAPTSSNRKVFNWFHWLVGNAAQIVGVAAIILGYELLNPGEKCIRYLSLCIIVGFVAFHILVHLLLTFTQCISDCKHTKEEESFPMKELGDNRMGIQSEPVRQDAPMGCLRKFFLAIYLPVNWIVTAVLILLVVFPKEQILDTFNEWDINFCDKVTSITS